MCLFVFILQRKVGVGLKKIYVLFLTIISICLVGNIYYAFEVNAASSYVFPDPNLVFDVPNQEMKQLNGTSYVGVGSLSGVSFPAAGNDWMDFPGSNKGVILSAFNPSQATFTATAKVSSSLPELEYATIVGNVESGGMQLKVARSANMLYFSFHVVIGGTTHIINGVSGGLLNASDLSNLTGVPYASNNEYVVVARYNKKRADLFVNGELLASKNITGSIDAPLQNTVWAVGGNPLGNTIASNPFI